MSITELKARAALLTATEKAELAEYLREQADPQLSVRRLRVGELMAEMDAGRKYGRKDFKQLDRKLTANGL